MSLRVLVVEDSALAGEMMVAMLRNEGFEVSEVARTGRDALATLRDGPYDVAIVDLELPDMSVSSLLQQLRERAPGMRLVACSAHDTSSAPVNDARRYVDSVIPKGDLPRSGQLIRNLCRVLPPQA